MYDAHLTGDLLPECFHLYQQIEAQLEINHTFFGECNACILVN